MKFFALQCALFFVPVAMAEESSANHTTIPLPTLEVAAAADGSFGNGTLMLPIWKGLLAEGVWYHSQERNVGFAGVGYAFRPRPWLVIVPSLYGVRGPQEHDKFGIGGRFLVEKPWIVADVGIIQTLGGKTGEDHDIFLDPSHLSARVGRLQIGYAAEFFRHNHSVPQISHLPLALAVTHPTNEVLHGPRIGWELNRRMQFFYLTLYKGDGHWEHKGGSIFFFFEK